MMGGLGPSNQYGVGRFWDPRGHESHFITPIRPFSMLGYKKHGSWSPIVVELMFRPRAVAKRWQKSWGTNVTNEFT